MFLSDPVRDHKISIWRAAPNKNKKSVKKNSGYLRSMFLSDPIRDHQIRIWRASPDFVQIPALLYEHLQLRIINGRLVRNLFHGGGGRASGVGFREVGDVLAGGILFWFLGDKSPKMDS
jgi:hypothetical protein